MNAKKAKRLRQLVKHLMSAGATEKDTWVEYGREQKYVEVDVPDFGGAKVFDEDGKLVMTSKKQLMAMGGRMMDPACGRAIYQSMKNREDRVSHHVQS